MLSSSGGASDASDHDFPRWEGQIDRASGERRSGSINLLASVGKIADGNPGFVDPQGPRVAMAHDGAGAAASRSVDGVDLSVRLGSDCFRGLQFSTLYAVLCFAWFGFRIAPHPSDGRISCRVSFPGKQFF